MLCKEKCKEDLLLFGSVELILISAKIYGINLTQVTIV
ncbi:MAG: hypothetical protein ACI837_002133 [Crocinitomicaceae bacterium]|jgi:hypothetical protein